MESMILQMSQGSLVTLKLFFITIILSMPLGLCITFLYTSKNKIVSKIISFYVLIMRGTPLLLQMFFVYFGLPFIPLIGEYMVFNRFLACAVAFTFNYAAYFSEIFRGGLISIDKGQFEASKVLGITKFQTYKNIILPQMFRVVMPSISNEAIILVKDTALITALSEAELLHVTKNIANQRSSILPYFVAGVFYLVMSYVLTRFFNYLEKRMSYE